MINELKDEKMKLKIKPKSEQYFLNKLLFNQVTKCSKNPYNAFEINNNKYKSLMNQNKSIFNNSDNDYYDDNFDGNKFKNKLLREAIKFSSKKKRIRVFIDKRKDKIKKKLQLLEKDVDLYSPVYKRLLSAQILKKQNRVINQNKTYENFIKNNIKNFLFSEAGELNVKKKIYS